MLFSSARVGKSISYRKKYENDGKNTQYRETRALQLKLDELIRSTHDAHNMLLSVEKLTDEKLDTLWEHYKKLAHEARQRLKQGISGQNVLRVALGPEGTQ